MVAAPARKCCHYNWIPLYLMDLFTMCSSGCGTGNGNSSKWVVTLFLQLRQWQTYTFITVICHCYKCSCEHFHFIVAEKPLPLPHRVNKPLVRKFNPTVSLQESDVRLRYKLHKIDYKLSYYYFVHDIFSSKFAHSTYNTSWLKNHSFKQKQKLAKIFLIFDRWAVCQVLLICHRSR